MRVWFCLRAKDRREDWPFRVDKREKDREKYFFFFLQMKAFVLLESKREKGVFLF